MALRNPGVARAMVAGFAGRMGWGEPARLEGRGRLVRPSQTLAASQRGAWSANTSAIRAEHFHWAKGRVLQAAAARGKIAATLARQRLGGANRFRSRFAVLPITR